ncbi:Crp/Fnr family transcriptional regulator [Allopontixanthobacter sediminis]|uniref:Helix-turn-helix domain-containing protein n=1 Tax=Allopontixanthobacter sediminis TaxID=1689985 RepID=A0A845AZ74_9SPHN|nr:helix-turn-helix domain-containing protein [Allopontixanthobacter sediminis]
MAIEQSSIRNGLLAGMSPADFALFAADLVPVELSRRTLMSSPEQTIKHCRFLEDGIASMVATSRDGQETEAGIVGREGMIDVATVLGAHRTPLRTFIQIPGHGLRVPARTLSAAYAASETIRVSFNQFAFQLLSQIAETALANASYSVERRLARWLLMCADRLGDNKICLTHEFLSVMLNVRRAGVTLAVQSLQGSGFLEPSRGSVTIVNRAGLEAFAKDAYTPL